MNEFQTESWQRQEPEAILTERRKENLAKAFNRVEWDFDSASLRSRGIIGDRPQFVIPGQLGALTLRYLHQSPGGGPSSLHVFFNNNWLYSFSPAPLNAAGRIQDLICPPSTLNIKIIRNQDK